MILKADVVGVGVDNSTAYQAYVKSRGLPPSGQVSELCHIRQGHLVARQQTGVSVRATIVAEFGGRTSGTSDAALTPAATETRVIRDFESLQDADLQYVQMQLGDASAVDSQWSLDMLVVNIITDGEA